MAKPEIEKLPGMKKLGAVKNFAVNMGAMISIISTIKKALPMYVADLVSLKNTAMALKVMLNEEGRADCKMMGVMCKDSEECETIRNSYEECYGTIPPALTSSERKWKNKGVEIDELLFPMPMPEGSMEMEKEMPKEEKVEMTEEEKKKEEEEKKKAEEKKQKDIENYRKGGAMKHYKKTKDRFLDDKTKFLEKFIAYLKDLKEDKDEAFDQEQLDTCCKEQEEHLKAVKSLAKKKDLIKKAKMAAAMGKTAMAMKEKLMPGKKEAKKEE